MKLFFISDIHGSLYYLNEALERFAGEGASHIVILGDELYHGARNPLPRDYNPKEVASRLNALADKIIAIRGNCDSEVDEMVLDFPMMSTYSSILWGNKRLFLTHGHIYSEQNLPKLAAGDVFFYGHTHIPVAKKSGDIMIINPGSISLSKEGNPNTYGVLEGNSFTVKKLDGTEFMRIDI
jgi:phosphoesterase, MJ0936 family